jgi:hypothetical protein
MKIRTLPVTLAFIFGMACAGAKQEAKTALDDLRAACLANGPQSVAVLVDPKSGEVAQIVCFTEEELANLLDPVLAMRRAALVKHAAATPSIVPAPSAPPSASASTGY